MIEMTLIFMDFKEAYQNAKSKKEDVFTVDNHTFVTQYGKYLIEYLEGQDCPNEMEIEFVEKL
jgi:hypothetical protein